MNKELNISTLFILSIVSMYLSGLTGGDVVGEALSTGFALVGLISFVAVIIKIFKKITTLFSHVIRAPYKFDKSSLNHNSATTTNDKIDTYSKLIFKSSVFAAEEIRKKYKIPKQQRSDIVTKILGFCIINLMRQLSASNIPRIVGQNMIKSILDNVYEMMLPEEFRLKYPDVLNVNIGKLVDRYADLPLKNSDSDSLNGTFLWEYSKLIAKSYSENNNIVTITECANMLMNVKKSLDSNRLIDSL